MERMWETIKKGLQDSAVTAINKAEDLTRLGHARLDIAAVKNKINQQRYCYSLSPLIWPTK